ncbi:extracellular solute-binding protein [Nigerium massiliense]|uniref:extracellular solute-binding protein n=1 Tax=Nigerium massiliense TaxID=1522317 RepID=UPI00058B11EF|nr:extracellular solute-binding protein [Nigerium massiliense]
MRKSSRRGRRTAAGLAAIAVVAPLVLAGCSGDQGGPPRLTWYYNPDDGGQVELAKRCSAASNGRYTIETSALPRDASSQREQLARRLAAGDTSMDIMSLDPPFVPELANPGFLAPVPANLQKQATSDDVVEGAKIGAQWDGKVVAVPFWANTQLLWYRKSVAEKAGLDMTKPVTWDQLIDANRKTQTHIGVQGIRGESATVWLNAMIESGGDHIIRNPTADVRHLDLGLAGPAGQKAAQITSTIGKEGLGGPGITTQDENVTLQNWEGDKGSWMVNYPFVYPSLKSSVEGGTVDKAVLDDMGWARYPRTDADKESAPPLGGIMLGVGAHSPHPDLAYDAISCITTPENQAYYFETNGNPASSKKAFDDPKVREAFPMAPLIRESLDAAKPRPQTPYYNEVSTAIQQNYTPLDGVNDGTAAATADFILRVLRGEALL